MRVILFVFLLLFAFAPVAKAADLPEQPVGAHTYYCPMHPEVSGGEGDSCPICGMYLVPQEGAAEHIHDHSGHDHGQGMPAAQESGTIHICPMHPHITGKEGDRCPICGMNLAPKENPQTAGEGDEQTLIIDPGFVQALGVRIAGVTHRNFGQEIRAFGMAVPSTRREHIVAVRAGGWIVDLAASAVGDKVAQGDLMFTYYSPDLMAAQSDYLIGSRVGNAEQRLRQYGMDDQAIALLRQQGKILQATPFYAPADGTVTALRARAGAYLEEGEIVLELTDLGEVWINADVPVRQLAFLKAGDPAVVRIPETGREIATTIDFIHPAVDPESRTGTVRLAADNSEGDLKPQTYVDVIFTAAGASRLAVPAEAVLYGGDGAYVFEAAGEGRFRPVMVETGITSGGFTEIRSGLDHGQRIVVSGQFMLDAETSLKGGMAAMGHDHSGQGAAMNPPLAGGKQETPGHVH